MSKRVAWRNFDWVLFGAIVGVALVGLVFIWSTDLAPTREVGSGMGREFKRQAMWLGISIAVFFGVIAVDYRVFRTLAYVLYGATLGALVVLLVMGTLTRGTRRWFNVMGIMSVQPSEFMKPALVLALARLLMYRRSIKQLGGVVLPAMLTAAPIGLILYQPDLGMAALLPVALVSMLFAAGTPGRRILPVLGITAAALGAFLWVCYRYDAATIAARTGGLRPYQVERVQAFLRPEEHPDLSYQYRMSLVAIGSGGITGKGWGQGTQNRLDFLPEAPTDFIFAVIGEERGFAGLAVLLGLYMVIVMRSLGIAQRTKEPFGRLIVVGVITVFSAQVLVNAGMTVGLVPITGMTLPLASYGGSSMVTTFAGLALVANVGMRRITVLSGEDFK